MADPTIREFQAALPWGAHGYNDEFRARQAPQRDVEHALVHVVKALGRLADPIDACSHPPSPDPAPAVATRNPAGKYLADLVICACRMANTWPGGPIDIQDAIADRVAEKFPGGAR